MQNNSKKPQPSKKNKDKKEALAENLRANLLRRKSQQRSKDKKGEKDVQ